MKELLYNIVYFIADIHSYILTLNDAYEANFTDKQLHFLVVGIFGMALVFIIHPIFKALAKSGHELVITWIYCFTLIIVLTFAIEIGQGLTGTGVMDFEDTTSGIAGFLFMFVIFAIIRGIVKAIMYLVESSKKKKK